MGHGASAEYIVGERDPPDLELARPASDALTFDGERLRDEERFCIQHLERAVREQRLQTEKVRQRLAKSRADFVFYRLLTTLGQGPSGRCHRCDMGFTNLQTIARGLRDIVGTVRDGLGAHDATATHRRVALQVVHDALAAAAHMDRDAVSLIDVLAKELADDSGPDAAEATPHITGTEGPPPLCPPPPLPLALRDPSGTFGPNRPPRRRPQ